MHSAQNHVRREVPRDYRKRGVSCSRRSGPRRACSGALASELQRGVCVWAVVALLLLRRGPGRKHDRPIVLTDWQRHVVDRWPVQLLRGLIHSDGRRFQNTGRCNWSCPRCSFTNDSYDVRQIYGKTCEQLARVGPPFGKYTLHVSRKADVSILDRFIGPKR